MNYQETKNRMKELRGEYSFIMENMDITGGQRGFRNNQRAYNRTKKILKEIVKLNRKLVNF